VISILHFSKQYAYYEVGYGYKGTTIGYVYIQINDIIKRIRKMIC